MKLHIAVDPGASGGIAWHDGEPHCEPMPQTDGDVKALLVRILSTPGATESQAHIEEVGGYVGKDESAMGSAMFGFGDGAGFVRGCLSMADVPIIMVRPQRWQKILGLGTREHCRPVKGMTREQVKECQRADGRMKTEWKTKLRDEAQRRFPACNVTKKTADALLILAAGMGERQ